MICFCNQVTEKEVKLLLKRKPDYSIQDIQIVTKAGTSCGRCKSILKSIVDEEQNKKPYRQLKLFKNKQGRWISGLVCFDAFNQ
jgi:bacterioferritin-associated ferredoxin